MNLLTSSKWFESKCCPLCHFLCLSTDSTKSCALLAFVLATLRRGAVLDGRTDPWSLGSFGSLSKLVELQNFSQLACVSTLSSSLTCFCNWLMRVFTAGSFIWEYCLLSVRFSLISANVSLEMGLLSDRTFLDFGMALSTAVQIVDTIKSAYLSRSLVDVSPEKSSKPSAA